ncbi:MAG: class I SAM-dependent methyltransferase [Fibrobacter sp.]|nr:class I SAM-dependent methyltransferase [Fibrobacter sp.]
MTRTLIFNNLSQEKKDAINRHLFLVMEKNKEMNLSAIRNIEEAKVLHIEDSLAALPELEDTQEGLYMDLGSGGGFPGIPLAIASGKKTMLVEATKKKANALSEFCKELDLENQVSVKDKRIEEITKEYEEKVSVITARAVTSATAPATRAVRAFTNSSFPTNLFAT